MGRGQDVLLNYHNNPIGFSLVNKLIRREIIHKHEIYPYEGINAGEDLNVSVRALFYASNVIKIDVEYYFYYQNPMSISNATNNIELWNRYIKRNTILTCYFIITHGGDIFDIFVNYLKYTEKRFLISYDNKLWAKTWSESNKYILKFNSIPLKIRYIMRLSSIFPSILSLYLKYINYRVKSI